MIVYEQLKILMAGNS